MITIIIILIIIILMIILIDIIICIINIFCNYRCRNVARMSNKQNMLTQKNKLNIVLIIIFSRTKITPEQNTIKMLHCN